MPTSYSNKPSNPNDLRTRTQKLRSNELKTRDIVIYFITVVRPFTELSKLPNVVPQPHQAHAPTTPWPSISDGTSEMQLLISKKETLIERTKTENRSKRCQCFPRSTPLGSVRSEQSHPDPSLDSSCHGRVSSLVLSAAWKSMLVDGFSAPRRRKQRKW